MAKAKDGSTVKVHYIGKLEDGTVFDNSNGGDPLHFTIGKNQVIKGFEDGVIGLEVGEKTTINIDHENAYGPYHEEYLYKIEKSKLPESIKLEVGTPITARNDDGSALQMVIIEVDEDTVTLDANHPLAGKNLIFEIELVHIDSVIIS
ncbi:MAG: peptidylprolyl isomerase [Candidatus Dadabacteria bacterium]|nr:peptidylprolyl isomerase [Candidatus Dadabacteria bacterium]NIQ16973.1 peptidylprolyl isomerase [Candidatus Dadabacteria bacterium]